MEHVSSLSSANLPNRSKPLILIVDDDRSLQMLLTVAMEQEAIETVQASSGEQCLHDYQRLLPDMVLLDAVMPGMDGFECCHKLRQLPNAERVPILIITVLDSPEYVDKAFQAGATDYITKPIQWGVLSHRVHRMLNAYQSAQSSELSLRILKRYQVWEQIQSQLLKAIQTKVLNEFLEFSLKKMRDFLGCDRVSLYQPSTQTCLNITAHNQELPDPSEIDFSNVWEILTKKQLNQPILINSVSGEPLKQLDQDIYNKLQYRALCAYPVVLENNLQAVLLAGYYQTNHEWLTFEQKIIQNLADLIAIAFSLNKQHVH